MKITKNQIRRTIREEKKSIAEAYNSMSPRSKSLVNAAKHQFAKDYPDVQVGIDGREGWIIVNGKKAVNMSQASGSPLSMGDIIDKMKQTYLGHDMLSQEVPELTPGRKSSWQVRKERELGESMKITKRQLRRIIREEKEKMLSEMNPDGTISGDEDEARQDLMDHVEMKLNELLDHIISESERIGGGFRGPGIKKQAFRLLADMIHSYRM